MRGKIDDLAVTGEIFFRKWPKRIPKPRLAQKIPPFLKRALDRHRHMQDAAGRQQAAPVLQDPRRLFQPMQRHARQNEVIARGAGKARGVGANGFDLRIFRLEPRQHLRRGVERGDFFRERPFLYRQAGDVAGSRADVEDGMRRPLGPPHQRARDIALNLGPGVIAFRRRIERGDNFVTSHDGARNPRFFRRRTPARSRANRVRRSRSAKGRRRFAPIRAPRPEERAGHPPMQERASVVFPPSLRSGAKQSTLRLARCHRRIRLVACGSSQ